MMKLNPIGILSVAYLFAVGCSGPTHEGVANLNEVAKLRVKFKDLSASTEGKGEELAGPEGYATLKGRFTLNGAIPERTTISITKHPNVCAPGGKPVYSSEVLVDSESKGIANILVFADKVPEAWLHESAKSPPQPEVLFDQKDCVFLTRVVAMQIGQTLLAKNSDSVGHNMDLSSKGFNALIPAFSVEKFVPKKQDTVPAKIGCSVHPWMTAWFVARKDGYFAVTKPDGSFEIPNLPAGVKLNFRVWHEKAGQIGGTLQVNGSDEKWKKGKFSKTLTLDGDNPLDVVLDASLFN